jgi:hypothetical protein
MAKYIVILTTQRSGSNHLTDVIRSHFNIKALFEVFDPNINPIYPLLNIHEFTSGECLKLKELFGIPDSTDTELSSYIREHPEKLFINLGKIIDTSIVIKVHLSHLYENRLDWLFRNPDVEFILLSRISSLEMFVSTKIAELTDNWDSTDTSACRITVNPAEYVYFKHKNRQDYYRIRNIISKRNYLSLTHEELVTSNSTLLKWITEHGVSIKEIPEPLFFKKQQRKLMSEVVLNYKEISQYIDF